MTSESPKWIGLVFTESPKWLALIFSIVAIAISCLSWWESHRNRLINEEVNRPILKSAPVSFRRDDYFDKTMLRIEMKVTNVGKSTAVVSDERFQAVMLSPFEQSGCKSGERVTEGTQVGSGSAIEVFPGTERSVDGSLHVPKACEDLKIMFSVTCLFTYSDPITGRQYFQKFSETASVSLKDLPID